jgi:hypothetical protein
MSSNPTDDTPGPSPDGQETRTGIVLSGHRSPMAWTLVFTKLTVEVDGEPSKGSWRKRFIAAGPGKHRIQVYFGYIGMPRGGEASTTVHIPDGATVTMAYRAPNLMTAPGRLEIRR